MLSVFELNSKEVHGLLTERYTSLLTEKYLILFHTQFLQIFFDFSVYPVFTSFFWLSVSWRSY